MIRIVDAHLDFIDFGLNRFDSSPVFGRIYRLKKFPADINNPYSTRRATLVDQFLILRDPPRFGQL